MKMRILSIMLILALALTGCAAEAPAVEEPVVEQPAEETVSESSFEWGTGEETEEEQEQPSYPKLALDYNGAGKEYVFTANTFDGQTIDSAELFAGAKVTMLNIWGTYCYPCLMEMPDLGQIAKDYADADFQIVGLICDVDSPDSDTGATAKEQIAETGADYTHLLATPEVIKNVMFDVYAVPTTLFLDSEGKLLCSAVVGSNSYDTWAAAIDELLAK